MLIIYSLSHIVGSLSLSICLNVVKNDLQQLRVFCLTLKGKRNYTYREVNITVTMIEVFQPSVMTTVENCETYSTAVPINKFITRTMQNHGTVCVFLL